jgi:hypothetical protein
LPGQTEELRPVQGGCRHLRARYKVQLRKGSHFPDRELVRYECEQARDIESDEDVDKCMESHAECWKPKD